MEYFETKLDGLFKNGRRINLSAGEVYHDVNDRCTSLGRILSGRLRMSRVLPSGREIILQEFLQGEIFGELLIFTDSRYKGRLSALGESILIEVSFKDVLDYLMDRDSLVSFMNSIARKNINFANKIEILSLKTVKQKIAYLLLLETVLTVKSISELADKLACSREALSRALSEMENGGVIRRKADKIFISDESALEDFF